MRIHILFLILCGLFAGLPAAEANEMPPDERISTMLKLAREAKLWQSPEWYKINLYHNAWRGVKSRVDDPTFFLAPNGKHDPQAELEATIAGAFDASMAQNSRQPNVCRWIARYQFLSRVMKAQGYDYVPFVCEGFERWKSGLAKEHVSLVFASIYLNSPASMYGHDFLRFDSAKPGDFNRLTDTTVGYTVNSGGDTGVGFLISSLSGGFPGNFVAMPYFMKVREYADLENRDLWEYQTDLQPDEIERMQAFIWQHSFTYINYYFFDDNCALMLLATLEAGRPSLNLIQDSKPWFIPLDTVKAVQQAGMVTKKRYRPSQYSTLIANVQRAPALLLGQALELANERQVEKIPQLPSQLEQAQMLDLAMGILEYQRNQSTSLEQAEPYGTFQLKLAGVRSRVEVQSTYPPAPTPRFSPDEGHNSLRVGVAAGQVSGAGYAQLNVRASYHDTLDPQVGFAPGSSSKMGDLYLRLSEKQLRFERLDLFDVFLPAVQTAWYQPPTVKANIAIRREVKRNDAQSPTALRVELGGGKGYRISQYGQVYALADGIVRLASDSNLAAGPVAGWVWQPDSAWRAESSAGAFWYAAGAQRNSFLYRASAGVAWEVLNNQNNLRVIATRQWVSNHGDAQDDFADIQMSYSHYF